jgi:L-asparaginase/Glu-tRNA(Gln) amidotransferase subunit D
LLQVFKDASDQEGKIFVNISQNVYKEKNSVMKEALEKYNIYFGGDMTTEAALAKLAYLIGKGLSKE